MEACEWTFASWILASHRSAHNRTFNQHQASQRLLTAPNISLELMLGIHTSPTPTTGKTHIRPRLLVPVTALAGTKVQI